MAISLYFGLPGCGKTSLLTKLAYDAVRKGVYENVYSNVPLTIPGVTIIDNECIGKYELRNCLLLIDEATLFADSRRYKEFTKEQTSFFLLHRHYAADIVLFTQQWDGVDRKIRVITDRVYYIYKTVLTGHWVSKYWRVPYGILFPDPKKTGEKLGEIVQGYSKPPWLVRLFAHRIYRPRYYKYFDSWECKELPALPEKYETNYVDITTAPIMRRWFSSGARILHATRKARRKDRLSSYKMRIVSTSRIVTERFSSRFSALKSNIQSRFLSLCQRHFPLSPKEKQ